MFCEMTSMQLMVIARSAERASKCAKELAARYVKTKPKRPPAFYLVSIHHNDIHAQRVEVSQPIAMTTEDLALHYGDEFLEFEQQFIGALRSYSSGASILRGEPGTGKTSFLRHLIAKLESSHRFYYLPVHAFRFVSFRAIGVSGATHEGPTLVHAKGSKMTCHQ
jgi:Cdc6-like AAA superfamily ATPase